MNILVDSQWLQVHLNDPALVVLDATVLLPAPEFDGDYRVASGHEGWAQTHIPGSRHADLITELADPHARFSFALPAPEVLVQTLANLGAGVGKTLVIYDRADGFWAARLWWMLRSLGIDAAVLDGGLNAWRAAGLPEHSGPAAPIAAAPPWPINLRPASWIDRSGVEAIVAGQASGVLICALGAALFEGTVPTRYARRGHIPGSRNLPARNLFDTHGRYLPKDALALAIGPTLLHSEGPLILYCGGGISAAANALALTLLGRQDIAIYDGSLQEWAADARLPMTTGAAPA
ncbi:3-mercaptopyruvate sulfurtransferase [Pseudomonas extremaustralis]|uniref:3-mercaptopyruvate sulfurtransferase n=1 Tax=Pseudomonas extremaustralis TaxID=359110 RepID=A0A5M9IVL9_9PSED|nr:rhodanese-like domain-containing protein [Pseudomonas extremaustralis]KAA8559555.1 3-mercaptopyruvate sulfurtransferase [Pseudomonas extremaustralis]